MVDQNRLISNYLKDSNDVALSMLLDLYFESLFKYGIRILPDETLVEDCIQELLISLWENRKRLLPIKDYRSYLFVSLRRKLIREATKNRNKKISIEDVEFGHEFSYEDIIIGKEIDEANRTKVHNMLDALSHKQREVIYLRFYMMLDYDSIASMLGIKKQSVKNLLQSALKAARELMIGVTILSILKIF